MTTLAIPDLFDFDPSPAPHPHQFRTTSQARALEILRKQASLRGCLLDCGGLRPRNKPLLIGASGSGKTAIVKELARELYLSLHSINAASWIVYGASTSPHTLTIIRDFVRGHREGILFLDEVDKVVGGEEGHNRLWSLSVFGEILALLDGDIRLKTSGWTTADISRLQAGFLVIGAGAWQHVAQKRRKTACLGFGPGSDPAAYDAMVTKDFGIPEELAFRFNSRLILIDEPTPADFETGIRMIHHILTLPVDEGRLPLLLEDACSARVGVRWLEQYLSDILLEHPSQVPRETNEDKAEEDDAGRIILAVEHWRQECDRLFRRSGILAGDIEALEWKITAVIPAGNPTTRSKLATEFIERLEVLREQLKVLPDPLRRFAGAITHKERKVAEVAMRNELEALLERSRKLLDRHPLWLQRLGLLQDLCRVRGHALWLRLRGNYLARTAPIEAS